MLRWICFFGRDFSAGAAFVANCIVLTIILVNTYLFIYWSPFNCRALPHFNPSTVSVWIDKSNIHKSSILTQRIWEIPQPNVNVGSLLSSFFRWPVCVCVLIGSEIHESLPLRVCFVWKMFFFFFFLFWRVTNYYFIFTAVIFFHVSKTITFCGIDF